MKKALERLGILEGDGDAVSSEEAMEMAAAFNKPMLVDLYVPF